MSSQNLSIFTLYLNGAFVAVYNVYILLFLFSLYICTQQTVIHLQFKVQSSVVINIYIYILVYCTFSMFVGNKRISIKPQELHN